VFARRGVATRNPALRAAYRLLTLNTVSPNRSSPFDYARADEITVFHSRLMNAAVCPRKRISMEQRPSSGTLAVFLC